MAEGRETVSVGREPVRARAYITGVNGGVSRRRQIRGLLPCRLSRSPTRIPLSCPLPPDTPIAQKPRIVRQRGLGWSTRTGRKSQSTRFRLPSCKGSLRRLQTCILTRYVIPVLPLRAISSPSVQINRAVLDFDFEKVCSVSSSNINIYGCLVCGKYFQGRGRSSYAFAHAIHDDHHVFINLETTKVSMQCGSCRPAST